MREFLFSNKNARMAYYRAVVRFFGWCDHRTIGEIADIEPLHVAAYVEALGKDFEKPTVKQHLAAIRMLFDCGGAFDRGCGHVAAKSIELPNQFHKR